MSHKTCKVTKQLQSRELLNSHTAASIVQILLAEDDAILQALLEVLSDAHPRRLLDPEAELLLLLLVIFLSNLKERDMM